MAWLPPLIHERRHGAWHTWSIVVWSLEVMAAVVSRDSAFGDGANFTMILQKLDKVFSFFLNFGFCLFVSAKSISLFVFFLSIFSLPTPFFFCPFFTTLFIIFFYFVVFMLQFFVQCFFLISCNFLIFFCFIYFDLLFLFFHLFTSFSIALLTVKF